MDGAIASAVVLPEDLQASASPSHKRRNSSIAEDHAKRLRLDSDQGSNDRQASVSDVRPAVPVRRERGRERRLFGAALGALSQNTATAGQKRRAEIEKKQLARRQSENEESDQRKVERVARRKEQRWREQRRFENESMRTRHDNLLHMAHFLQTKTEPHLYYKPWETSPEEDERIKDQIIEAKGIIKVDLEDYEARQRQKSQRNRLDFEEASRVDEDTHNGKDPAAGALQGIPATNSKTVGSSNSPGDLEMKDDHAESPGIEAVRDKNATEIMQNSSIPSHETITDDSSNRNDDENGEDVVEEAAEDTVIY